MKILATSDTHGVLLDDIVCDILCIAGDISPTDIDMYDYNSQLDWYNDAFCPWCEDLDTEVVMIPGNHDFLFEKDKINQKLRKNPKNLHLLMDSGCVVKGVRFHGMHWNHTRAWAFFANSNTMRMALDEIPDNVDILLTHTPPTINGCSVSESLQNIYGGPIMDFGSRAIADMIPKKNPSILVCGHVHSGDHKPFQYGKTTIYNVSLKNERYEVAYPVTKIDYEIIT